MDLQTFVRETLLEIVAGVAEAQEGATKWRSVINPPLLPETDPAKRALPPSAYEVDKTVLASANLIATGMGFPAEMVEFDIALTVSEGKTETSGHEGGGKIDAKLHVASLGFGRTGKKTTQADESNSSVSRVKFRVPVVFPRHK